MKDASQNAWAHGFLTASKKVEDYHLGAMNMGWEVPGPWDVAMQVKDLDLKATAASV